MANTEVETIGVRLTLDAAGYIGKAEAVTAANNAMSTSAQKAASGASQMRAAGGAQVAGGGRAVTGTGPSTSQMAAVNVPLTVNAESLATLRAAIIKGIGSIPINISPTVSKSIATEAKNVVAAVSTPAIGTRSGAARAVETAVRNNMPTRAHGGPVQQGRAVLVGEKRAEVYIPPAHGTIHPDAERYYREQARLRKREAELAALEYQQQQQHERQMHRAPGGRVSPANAERRSRAYAITHGHGNIRGWENAQWRAQQAAEKAEDAMLVRYDAERTRWSPLFPSSNTLGWKKEPEPTISNIPVKGEPLDLWGRAHGGPAHKGGLPRGYHIEFYSPQSNDHEIRNFGGRLDKPGSGFRPIKKPLILAKDYVAGLVAVVMKGDKVAATFPFSYRSDPEQWGVPTPAGSFHPDYSITGAEHRRKGLATAAYVKVERFTGRPVAPSNVQLTRGKAFWAQPDRPFGKIFGDRSIDVHTRSQAVREEEEDRAGLAEQRRFEQRRQAAQAIGSALSQPGNLYCPTCGTAAGPYTSQTNLDVHRRAAHGDGRDFVAEAQAIRATHAASLHTPATAPMFGQPTPLRTPRRPRRNDPQEQMRRAIFTGQFGEVDPWAAPAHVPRPAPVFGDVSSLRRARGGLVEQITRNPEGGKHVAPMRGNLYDAVQNVVGNLQSHSLPGGYVGIAPIGRGVAVQLHAPSGEIEAWRILRAKKAGFGAMAYRATMENEGGTFPLSGGPQPPKGYAVGIATGTSHLVEDPSNFRDFLKQFNAQKKSQLAAGSFPPYVGTWLHEGQIHIDPAAVLGRKREADMVARAKAQLAFFDLKRFDEIPTSSHRLRANAERIQQLIMAGRKRESGGPISRSFTVADPMGLHIRPSALLAKVAARFPDTNIVTRNLTSGFAPHEKHGFEHLNARQMWDWGLLGAKTGDQVEMTGEGGNASLALHQLARVGGSPKATGIAKRRLVRNWRASNMGRAGGGLVNATPGELDFVGNLRAASAQISPDQMKFGKVWYSDAQKWISEQAARYGIDPTTARGVTAALSAGTAWGANKAKAHRVFSTHGQGLFGESFPYNLNLDAHKKAKAIIEGADPWAVLGHTPKVGQFYQNLGGDLNAVTLDRWAYRTATRGRLSDKPSETHRLNIDAAYRQVAGELGMNPVEFQAAAWLYERETHPRLGKKGKPQSLGQLEGMFSPMRAAGGPALGGMTPPLNQIAHPGFVSSMFQTAADWANDPFMAIMAWQQQASHKAEGGPVLGPLQRRLLGLPEAPKVEIPKPIQPFEPEWLKRAREAKLPPKIYRAEGGPTEGGQHLDALRIRMDAAREGNPFRPAPMPSPEQEWMRRARESRLPPKIYRAGGGPVSHLFTVADQLGLHMRPSAHLARMAADFDAFISVENLTRGMPQRGVVDAKYMHHLLALGARQGDQLRLRATGTDAEAAVRAIGGLIESPGLTRIASANRSLERADPARIRASEIFSKFTGRAAGGSTPKGLYIVGEIGKELFVPNRLTHMIPKRVMDQIPKAQGGMQVIGEKPNSLFAPPEDGIIVPNRLMDQVPHAAGGAWPGGIPRNRLMGMDRLDDPTAESATNFFLGSHGRVAPTPPAYGVGGGYKPDPMVAASTEAAAALGKVAAAATGAATAQTKATVATSLGMRPGFQNIEGVAVPPGTPEDTIRQIKTRSISAPPEAVAQLSDMQTVAEHTAQYAKLINDTVTKAPRVTRVTRPRISDELAIQMAGAGSTMPSRTPRGAVASIGSYLFGGVQQLTQAQKERSQAQQRYDKAVSYTERVVGRAADSVKSLREQVAAGTISNVDAAAVVKTKLAPAVREAAAVEKKRATELVDATKNTLPTAGGVLKNLGVIIGATTAYGMAMQLASTVITDAALPAAGKLLDQIMGFSPTFTKVTSGLADTTRQMGGNYQAAIASASATSGLSKATLDWVTAATGTTVQAKAGAKSFAEARDLMRAAMGAAGRQTPQGMYGGYGGLFGGAAFAEQLGGGQGLQEEIVGALQGSGIQQNYIQPPGMAGPGVVGPAATTMYSDKIMSDVASAMGRAARRENAPAYGVTNKASQTDLNTLMSANVPTEIKDMAKLGYAYTDSAGKVITNLDDLNKALGQVAEGYTIPDTASWAKTVERSLQAQFDGLDIASMVNRSIGIPLQFAMQRLETPYGAAGAGLIPNARGVGNIMGGIGGLPGGAGFSTQAYTGMLGALGVTGRAATLGGAAMTLGNTQAAEQQVANAQAIKDATERVRTQPGASSPSVSAQTGFVTGTNGEANAASYKALMDSASASSKTLQGLTDDIAELNATAANLSWANTTRLALRGISDAVGTLAGATGKKGGSELGQIEGQLWKIGRASQSLSLQLQQREITTQLAQAQFQAPGQTGEERFFAQKEAIAKAGIQQQQLGFSQQSFDLIGKQWIIQANRNIEDSQKAWAAEVASHQAASLQAASALAIATTSTKIATDLQKASDIYGTASAKFDAVLSTLKGFVDQFGGNIGVAGKDLTSFGGLIGQSATGITNLLSSMGYKFSPNAQTGGNNFISPGGMSGAPSTSTNIPSSGALNLVWSPSANAYINAPGSAPAPGRNDGGHAAGFLGNVSGAANMTVGEAGSETVAILRNPRAGSLAPTGGGASGPVTVNINGPVVRNEQDIAELARCVAIEVEKSLARKGQMFGLRGAAV